MSNGINVMNEEEECVKKSSKENRKKSINSLSLHVQKHNLIVD
jgi:hypothetical protein